MAFALCVCSDTTISVSRGTITVVGSCKSIPVLHDIVDCMFLIYYITFS